MCEAVAVCEAVALCAAMAWASARSTWGMPEKRERSGVTMMPPPMPSSPDRNPALPPAVVSGPEQLRDVA